MSAKSLVCPNCNARIDDFDRSTGIGTCAYCGAIVSDPDFVVKPTSTPAPQPAPAPVVINVTAPAAAAPAPAVSPRSERVALILCYALGMFGGHRFYAGKVGTGIIWLFTAGCFLVGWFIDAIAIASDHFTDADGLPLVDATEGPRPWWNRTWGAAVIVVAIIVILAIIGQVRN